MTNDVRFLNFVFKTNSYNPTFSITTKGCNNNSLAKNNSEQTDSSKYLENQVGMQIFHLKITWALVKKLDNTKNNVTNNPARPATTFGSIKN